MDLWDLGAWGLGGATGDADQESDPDLLKGPNHIAGDIGGRTFTLLPGPGICEHNVVASNFTQDVVVGVSRDRIEAFMLMVEEQPGCVDFTRKHGDPADGVIVVGGFPVSRS